MAFRAVVFDLGGVVFPSPFDAFAEYEREHGLPERFVREVVAASADTGAWAGLERGELSLDEFAAAFADESARAGAPVDGRALLARVGERLAPHPEMVAVIGAVRDAGLRTAALTNNWSGQSSAMWDGGGAWLREVFDVVVESAVEGLRKPDPAIYELCCARLGVAPVEAVLLDDLGVNLKPARAMGMATIKVVDRGAAIAELSELLGVELGTSAWS